MTDVITTPNFYIADGLKLRRLKLYIISCNGAKNQKLDEYLADYYSNRNDYNIKSGNKRKLYYTLLVPAYKTNDKTQYEAICAYDCDLFELDNELKSKLVKFEETSNRFKNLKVKYEKELLECTDYHLFCF